MQELDIPFRPAQGLWCRPATETRRDHRFLAPTVNLHAIRNDCQAEMSVMMG